MILTTELSASVGIKPVWHSGTLRAHHCCHAATVLIVAVSLSLLPSPSPLPLPLPLPSLWPSLWPSLCRSSPLSPPSP